MTNLEMVIKRGPWPLQKKAMQIAKDAQMMTAHDSEAQRDQIERYRRTEDYELKDQRIKLSNPVTPGALAPVFSVFENISRLQPDMDIQCKSDDALARINTNFGVFFGRKPLLEYLFNCCLWASKNDPNAWVVLESSKDFDPAGNVTEVTLYPMLYICEEIWDVKYDHSGQATVLTVRQVFETSTGEKYSEYREYQAGKITHAVQLHKETDLSAYPKYDKHSWAQEADNSTVFLVREYKNTTTRLMAGCLGAYKKKENDRTFVSLFNEAMPQLHELIKTGNFLDMHEVLHAFAKQFEYVQPCKHVNKQSKACVNGYYGGNKEHMCEACNGLGVIAANSEQQKITLKMPTTQDGFFDLQKMVAYADRPLTLIEFWQQSERYGKREVYLTVFNQDETKQAQASPETATEFKLNYDAQFNKVRRFTQTIEDLIELFYMSAFGYYGVVGDVEAKYPADYQFITFDELIERYKQATDAGLGQNIVRYIYYTLLKRIYQDTPERYDEAVAIDLWKPFNGKSSDEVVFIISLRAADDSESLLWQGWNVVERNLAEKFKGKFYKASFEQQRQFMEEQAELLRSSVKLPTVAEIQPLQI